MKISTALLYIIYKHNDNRHKMTVPDLANYVKELLRYDMLEIGEDGLSLCLSEKGLDMLVNSGLLETDK